MARRVNNQLKQGSVTLHEQEKRQWLGERLQKDRGQVHGYDQETRVTRGSRDWVTLSGIDLVGKEASDAVEFSVTNGPDTLAVLHYLAFAILMSRKVVELLIKAQDVL